LVPVRFKI